ncbi:CueP family metal-binding protein [Bacillaceae bacterium Marseille-Q3522]|nr:CueP family metal-binding protein [Bacillaceae bacterium Marseille-Q3522]
MKKKVIIAVSGLAAIGLAVFLFFIIPENNAPTENDAQSIKELVQDYSASNREDQSASITPQQLIVTGSDNKETTYDLPEDEFFVSIAPYMEATHPCAVHSLTGCRGELANKEFSVYIEDKNGNVVLDKTLQSQSNGFIDLWLPRDNTYQVTITQDGKTAQSEISTFENDNTCITTMQLAENSNS